MSKDEALTNQQIIEKVTRWQKSPYTPHLTCGGDREKKRQCRKDLLPSEKNGKVVLTCPDVECSYLQEFIPHPILNADFEKLDASYTKLEEATGSLKNALLKKGFYAFTCSEIKKIVKEKYPDADSVSLKKKEEPHLAALVLHWVECINQFDTTSLEYALKASRFLGYMLAHAKMLKMIEDNQLDMFVDIDIYYETHLPRNTE